MNDHARVLAALVAVSIYTGNVIRNTFAQDKIMQVCVADAALVL